METGHTDKKKNESRLLFLEKAIWKNGQEIITVLFTDHQGKRHRVGHIYLNKHEDKKRCFLVCDSKGNPILPPETNLYALKKQILEKEEELAKTITYNKIIRKSRGRSSEKGPEL